MTEPFKLSRIASLKSVADFCAHLASLGLDLPCEDTIATADSPLLRPVENLTVNGKRIGNRWAIHPMEGWDGTTTGGVTDEMRRRWQRGVGAVVVKPAVQPPGSIMASPADQASEIAKLRRELDRTRMERDILKKAVGIFAEMPR